MLLVLFHRRKFFCVKIWHNAANDSPEFSTIEENFFEILERQIFSKSQTILQVSESGHFRREGLHASESLAPASSWVQS